MNQSSWIAVSLLVGFFVFITVRGELTAYQKAIFTGQADSSTLSKVASTVASGLVAGATAGLP